MSNKYIPGFWDGNGAPRADVLSRWPSRTADFSRPAYDYVGFEQDGGFADACKSASISPSKRQWRKWSNGRGAARAAIAK